jgi:hypothetical protein
MLRPFPPANASRSEIISYQVISDTLLKPVSSSYISQTEPTTPYDETSLSDLTNLSAELLDELKNAASAAAQSSAASVMPNFDSDTAKSMAGLNSAANSGDTSDGFILAMIFKIVPIGVNIAKRGKTIVQGLKETSMGIVDLIKNVAILTSVIGMDTIEFVSQLFIYTFKLLLCSVSILLNFPKCVIFYILDIFMFILFACFISVLFIIDVFLLVKYWAGTSCVEMFMMLMDILEKVDEMAYSTLSIHIFHYPDSIINMCYSCSAMGDTSGYKTASSNMYKDIFVSLPNDVGGPIGEIVTGFGHLFSFFDLS